MIQNQIVYLRSHVLRLPYNERPEAFQLLNRWQSVRRLSQTEQLRLDKLIEKINESKPKRVGVQKE
jgi:hypothetical protein